MEILTCDKCDDIHIAQRDGKTCDECKCTCHNNVILYPQPYYPPYNPCIPDPCCPTFVQPYYTYTTGTTTCNISITGGNSLIL